jgi:hypothetical protein
MNKQTDRYDEANSCFLQLLKAAFCRKCEKFFVLDILPCYKKNTTWTCLITRIQSSAESSANLTDVCFDFS